MADDFTLGQATDIAHKCAIDVSGQERELDPSAKLEAYNIITAEHEDLLKKDVRTNDAIGLPSYGRTINANALKDLTKQWTIAKLRDVIFDTSVSSAKTDAFSHFQEGLLRAPEPQPSFSRSNLIAAALITGAAGFIIGFLGARRS